MTAFGHGKHTCPAQPFSLSAMTKAVTQLLGAYEMTPTWTTYPRPVPAQIGGVARAAGPAEVTYTRSSLNFRRVRGRCSRVEVDGLVMRYGDTTAVDGLSLTVEAQTITAVLGPNGAGKTTTLETCEGYRAPQAARSGCWASTRARTGAPCSPGSA